MENKLVLAILLGCVLLLPMVALLSFRNYLVINDLRKERIDSTTQILEQIEANTNELLEARREATEAILQKIEEESVETISE